MSEFNFKSQVCTSRSQSERLLALGLKPETADMCHIENKHYYNSTEYKVEFLISPIYGLERLKENQIPAWSLDRLRELYKCVGDTSLWNLDDVNYDRLIQCIGLAIKHNSFNKEYLE